MILKQIMRFGAYLFLIVIIGKMTSTVNQIYQVVPKQKSLIDVLAVSYVAWIILIGAITIGIVGTFLIEKIINFLQDK